MPSGIITLSTNNSGKTPIEQPLFVYENITPESCAAHCISNNCTAVRLITDNPYSVNNNLAPNQSPNEDITTNVNKCSIYTNSNINLMQYSGPGSSTMGSLISWQSTAGCMIM